MIGDMTPWPNQKQNARPGRRPPSPHEPTVAPSTHRGRPDPDAPAMALASAHHGEHRPVRARPDEVAHLLAETSYYCSRCGQENPEAAVTCRVCGVRFLSRATVFPLDERASFDPSGLPDLADTPDAGNED